MSYNANERFPEFSINGMRYLLTYQAEFNELVLLEWNGSAWLAWGGQPGERSILVEGLDDAQIMARGGVYRFMVWLREEAKRRAGLRANLPLPDPSNRVERVQYALMQLMTDDDLSLPNPPLP